MRSRTVVLVVGLGVVATSCKTQDGAAAGAVAPAGSGDTLESAPGTDPEPVIVDEGPLPKLRIGTRAPIVQPEVAVDVRGHADRGAHFYELTVPPAVADAVDIVAVSMSGPEQAVATIERVGDTTRILVRTSVAASELSGRVHTDVYRDGAMVTVSHPFGVADTAGAAADPALADRWTAAFGAELRGDRMGIRGLSADHPWRQFAAGRIARAHKGTGVAGAVELSPTRPRPRTELSELMYTTVAATSMQEALQHDRGLRLQVDAGAATVPLAALTGPELVEHPWPTMSAALSPEAEPVGEPLAAATPAEFWYVRFDDIRVMLRVLDEASAWGTPLAHIFEERGEVHDLAARYQRQLGLRRTGLAKALGHTVVKRVAVVGSDPYLREGSDVTFIFDLSNGALFDRELDGHMASYRREIAGIAESTVVHGAHRIDVLADPSGVVRQHRVRVGDRAIVSNSAAACRAVLDAIDGKRDRLADEEDLAYMLARDPGAHDGFAFLGDRFIASVVGAEQKIKAARRQQALAELLTPGYAALLYGWLHGAPPPDTATLVAAGLLMPDELAHADGSPIRFEPGASARSDWGTPAALTPLIERPRPTLVTEAERNAYAAFASGYQDYWRDFIDPIAVRLDVQSEGGADTAVVDVRVLPLIAGSDYGRLEEIVGAERIAVPEITDGLQAVWAVGADSELRRELDRAAMSLTGVGNIGLGWLGDWVCVGTLDRRALVDLLVTVDEDIQLPPEPDDARDSDRDVLAAIGQLPVYAAAHVRNPVSLVASLAAARAMVSGAGPGVVRWEEHTRIGEVPVVRIGIDPATAGKMGDFAELVEVFYAQVGDVFVVTLRMDVLEVLVERLSTGRAPTKGVAGGPQFVIDARLAKRRASFSALSWALQGQANRTQDGARAAAEILLRGDPTISSPEQLVERGLAYFGSYPVSASGRPDFSWSDLGVTDPIHGSRLAPAYPELPVAGSPVSTLMDRLSGVRATVAFDREPAAIEPPARSLHTHLELQLGTTP